MTKQERIDWLKTCTIKARREYYGQVAELGCIISGMSACVHHCYGNQFPAKREHRPVIPLSYEHHQGEIGIHSGKETFEAHYGTQNDLLEKTEARLNG